jgi:hypothetical protein
MNSRWIKNIYDQFHSWFQAVGVFMVGAVASYFIEHSEWTWKGIVAAAAGAFVAHQFARNDHKKTKKAVGEAVIKTQEILEKEGELKQ